MELTIDDARQALAAQPFSVLLGARIVAFGGGGTTLEIDIRDEHKQQNGFVHGGVLAYAADNTITFAAGSVLGPSVLTGRVAVEYLRPAVGRVLVARADVTESSARRAEVRCELFAQDDSGTRKVVATAAGTVVVVNRRG
ncbi:PaaI family thioesterase [Actinophytocola sp. NPDC049390]|uniref:PaaI family thioesterase n=1 Tax=Actinophytocola sp. NPDC049390 TaxID=3363894 RepID=UPI0037B749E4